MTDDDPRHGETRGYYAGCRDTCCRKAMARYEKEGRLARLNGGRIAPALGVQRRIQALLCLGWTTADIAEALGWDDYNYVLRLLKGQKGRDRRYVLRSTHEAVVTVYKRLSMRLPEPAPHRSRSRSMAAKRGWVPPLAWDNIDDPDEKPHRGKERGSRLTYDEAVVLRILAGDFHLPATPTERREVVRRWQGSLADLERQTGWRPDRYVTRDEGAA